MSRVFLDVERGHRGLMTSFPVARRPEVVSGGPTVAVRSLYCINVEWEVVCCEFVDAVSAIFPLPVGPETAIGGP